MQYFFPHRSCPPKKTLNRSVCAFVYAPNPSCRSQNRPLLVSVATWVTGVVALGGVGGGGGFVMETYWSTEVVARRVCVCVCVGVVLSLTIIPPPPTQDTGNVGSLNFHTFYLSFYLAVVFFVFIVFVLLTFWVTALGDKTWHDTWNPKQR